MFWFVLRYLFALPNTMVIHLQKKTSLGNMSDCVTNHHLIYSIIKYFFQLTHSNNMLISP